MNPNTFRLQRGLFCQLLPDKIVISRTENGIPSQIEPLQGANPLIMAIPLYLIMLGAFTALSVSDEKGMEPSEIIPMLVFAAFIVYRVVTNMNTSLRNVIDRATVERVVFKEGTRFLTLSRFEVYFRHENGKLKKRVLALPGEWAPDRSQNEKAVRIFIEAGLLTSND